MKQHEIIEMLKEQIKELQIYIRDMKKTIDDKNDRITFLKAANKAAMNRILNGKR